MLKKLINQMSMKLIAFLYKDLFLYACKNGTKEMLYGLLNYIMSSVLLNKLH